MRIHHSFPCIMLLLAGLGLSGCGDDSGLLPGDGGLPDLPGSGVLDNPVVIAAAEACGIDIECEGAGIAEGNASISGVASIDAFFGAVVNFQAKADNVSAGIDAELEAIRGAFGIEAGADLAAGIQAQIEANVEGSLKVEAEPARCQADVQASLDAKARCEGEVNPGSVMVACSGSCEVEASAEVSCSAEADLKCTVTAPSVACEGECKGSCEVELSAMAACDGTCEGECTGECSAYSDSGATQCAGKCDGMCMGSCTAELAAGASCEGTCKGECTVTNPDGGCEGGIRASCDAKGDAMVMCEGRCEGEVEPPSASVECEASVKAEAKMSVECTPPRVAINYELKANVDAQASAQFEAGINSLKVRLPALLASIKRAELLVDAGGDLVAEAGGALESGIDAAGMAAADGDLKVLFGLRCAINEASAIPAALGGSLSAVEGSVSESAKLTGALGMN